MVSRINAQSRAGFALIMVLWLITLLTIIAMGLAYNSRQSVRAMSGLAGNARARYVAESGVQLAIMNLLKAQAEHRLSGDGRVVAVEVPGGRVAVTVTDESGKIDINTASPELLARLFVSFDVDLEDANALADAVIDYRDEDNLVSLHGAEDDDYLAAGLPWEAKDSKFTRVAEIQRVYGMDLSLAMEVMAHVTVYTESTGINPEVASLQILRALSEEPVDLLQAYIDQRRESHIDGLPPPVPPVIDRQFVSAQRSDIYTIAATGKLSSNHKSSISTVVRLDREGQSETIETLDWTSYRLQSRGTDGENDNLSLAD